MSDNIETGLNGESAFASFREPAWHGLGTVFDNEVTTSEMLDLAHLSNWQVRVEEVPLPVGYSATKPPLIVVRDNPFFDGSQDMDETNSPHNVLGVVGDRYKVLQNEELFDFGDALLDGGGRWETAGSIKNGTQVFGALALDRETILDPSGVSDKVSNYLLMSTSHDGSLSVQASITPVRVVCANTLAVALAGVRQSFRIRHTQTLNGRLQSAREALDIAHRYYDEFDKLAQAMIETEMTRDQFDQIITIAYPKPDEDVKGSMAKWETKRDSLFELLDSPTNRDVSNTAWGGYNALNERVMWGRPVRGNKLESMLASASGFDLATNRENDRLLQIVKTNLLVA
jgi:phage/plasmid-like protein (TIGR03299 family)